MMGIYQSTHRKGAVAIRCSGPVFASVTDFVGHMLASAGAESPDQIGDVSWVRLAVDANATSGSARTVRSGSTT